MLVLLVPGVSLLKCKADGEGRSFFPRVMEKDAEWPTELKSIILHGPKGGGQESYLSMAIPMMWSRASPPSLPKTFLLPFSFLLPFVDMLARNVLLEVRASAIFFQVPYLLACLLTNPTHSYGSDGGRGLSLGHEMG